MNHNLETLRKAIFLESFKEIRKELEGFDKELRELFESGRIYELSADELKKEIFGE